MPDNEPKVSLNAFLEKFPEVVPPITLTNDMQFTFSKNNDPLTQPMIRQYLEPLEGERSDEMTEFIPCFRIAQTHEFHAIVYFKASLLDYRYVLVTFTQTGIFVDKQTIAGTYSDGELLVESVASIEDDWEILIVSGKDQKSQNEIFDPTSSRAYRLEMLPDGKIVEME